MVRVTRPLRLSFIIPTSLTSQSHELRRKTCTKHAQTTHENMHENKHENNHAAHTELKHFCSQRIRNGDVDVLGRAHSIKQLLGPSL